MRVSQAMTDTKTTIPRTSSRRGQPRRSQSDWRIRGRSAPLCEGGVLAAGLLSSGIAIIASGLVGQSQLPWAPPFAVVVLWAGLITSVAASFRREVPAGLLRFATRDIIWGLSLGLTLRVVQGAISSANTTPFPSTPEEGAAQGQGAALSFIVTSGLISPIVEEFFFRGLILVCVWQILVRSLNLVVAGAISLTISTLAFMALHLVFAPLGEAQLTQLALVGVLCGVCTVATGRVWGAVLTHLVYNASFLGLLALGST